MKFSQSIIEIINTRSSIRDYSNNTLTIGTINQIKEIIHENNSGPFGNKIRFELIEKNTSKTQHKVKLGTYGFISGAQYFIAASIDPHKFMILEDYGYLLEKIILHLTDMDLGTCWLGGTFKRNDFSTVLGYAAEEVIPAITPLGEIKKKQSLRNSIIRWGAKSNSRKPWSELFFDQHFGKPLSKENSGVFQTPMEMLRLAPSASNKQPWRIIKQNNAFHFYLLETPGYNNIVKAVKLQQIDMGIAMAHFELSCKELRLKGKWVIEKLPIEFTKATYTATWQS